MFLGLLSLRSSTEWLISLRRLSRHWRTVL